MLYFMDRYFYRENKKACEFYPLKRNAKGVYKLDDDFYLNHQFFLLLKSFGFSKFMATGYMGVCRILGEGRRLF